MDTTTNQFTAAERAIMAHNFPKMTQHPGAYSCEMNVLEEVKIEFTALGDEAQEYFAERIWSVHNAWLEAMASF